MSAEVFTDPLEICDGKEAWGGAGTPETAGHGPVPVGSWAMVRVAAFDLETIIKDRKEKGNRKKVERPGNVCHFLHREDLGPRSWSQPALRSGEGDIELLVHSPPWYCPLYPNRGCQPED